MVYYRGRDRDTDRLMHVDSFLVRGPKTTQYTGSIRKHTGHTRGPHVSGQASRRFWTTSRRLSRWLSWGMIGILHEARPGSQDAASLYICLFGCSAWLLWCKLLLVWMTASVARPVSNNAKVASKPGSFDTAFLWSLARTSLLQLNQATKIRARAPHAGNQSRPK